MMLLLLVFVVCFCRDLHAEVFQKKKYLQSKFLDHHSVPIRSKKELPTVIPTDGMKISKSCVFKKGVYEFPNGISVTSDFVEIDFGGSEFIGSSSKNVGVTVSGLSNITIYGGIIRSYYYGIKIENCSNIEITSMDMSYNYYDPHVFQKTPPWLDINVVPSSYGDLTNLGGGIFMNNVKGGLISENKLQYQENGMDLFNVIGFSILNNDASNNVGWGIHLYRSSYNRIEMNIANNCTRKGPNYYWTGDTSGLLLNCRSSNNLIVKNKFLYGGDGVFVSGFPRQQKNECCPSINNFFESNDCSFSPNNAFEDTFSTGNVFVHNIANGSDYGFWLGYSYGNIILENDVSGNMRDGVAIDHGHHNIIRSNRFSENLNGVNLWTDFIDHFPAAQFGCLDLPKPTDPGDYELHENYFTKSRSYGLSMNNITESMIYNNLFDENSGHSALDGGTGSKNNQFWTKKTRDENILGGPFIAGNFWKDYEGKDTNHDGIGDTDIPYLANGNLKKPGDMMPIVPYSP